MWDEYNPKRRISCTPFGGMYCVSSAKKSQASNICYVFLYIIEYAPVKKWGVQAAVGPRSRADRFLSWARAGAYTADGEVFDIGRTTSHAITRIEEGKNPLQCGDADERSNGNGSLMRILPAAHQGDFWG